jgi:hypothetical protein
MATLHLHNKPSDLLPQPTELGNGIWGTGAWYVSEARAATMKGADIHLHRTKSEPSFLAGKIEDFERRNYLGPRDGKAKLRTYFKFRMVAGMEGRATDTDG